MSRFCNLMSIPLWCACRPLFIGAMVWAAASFPALGAAELRIERMFGPEVKTGPYKHPARIEELKNGDLYAVYYGGEGEYATDTGVFGSRLKKSGRKWATPTRIAPDTFRSLGNGVVCRALRRDVVHLARAGESFARQRRDVVGRFPARQRRGHDGLQPADCPAQRRLPVAAIP